MTFFVQDHQSQSASTASATTRRYGCTWTAGANGVAATTGGRRRPTPDQVHSQVATKEQTDPSNPGWSIPDLDLAMDRMQVGFANHSGQGWTAVIDALEHRHYVVLQGDSDQFGNGTCSGAFDGDHAIGVHPKSKIEDGERWWWIDDSICKTGRWERESVIKRYAQKLNARIQFGVFTDTVPDVAPKPPARPVTLRPGARKLANPTVKTVKTRSGHARRRTAPRPTARITARPPNGRRWTAYQVIDNASGRWFGNRTNTRWMRRAAF